MKTTKELSNPTFIGKLVISGNRRDCAIVVDENYQTYPSGRVEPCYPIHVQWLGSNHEGDRRYYIGRGSVRYETDFLLQLHDQRFD